MERPLTMRSRLRQSRFGFRLHVRMSNRNRNLPAGRGRGSPARARRKEPGVTLLDEATWSGKLFSDGWEPGGAGEINVVEPAPGDRPGSGGGGGREDGGRAGKGASGAKPGGAATGSEG